MSRLPSYGARWSSRCWGAARGADAELLVYEPFDYPADAVLAGTAAGGLNLAGSYVSSAVPDFLAARVVGPGLDYGSLAPVPSVAGNRLTQPQGTTSVTLTIDVDQDVDTGPGTATFFSALFTFDDSANGNHLAHVALQNDTGDSIGFGEAGVGVRAIRITASTAATGGLIADGADGAFTNGQTLLLIGRYVNASAAGSDLLELIGYDTALSHTLPASFDPLDPGAQFSYALSGLSIDMNVITSLAFTLRAAGNNAIDEVRIGSTYADIIPEPTAAVLLSLAAVGATARRRPRTPRAR